MGGLEEEYKRRLEELLLHSSRGSEEGKPAELRGRRAADGCLCCSRSVPRVGPSLQKPFSQYLEAQRSKLHHAGGTHQFPDDNWLSWLFEKLVLVMVCYFVISIVNSTAQSYAKRLQQQRHSQEKTK